MNRPTHRTIPGQVGGTDIGTPNVAPPAIPALWQYWNTQAAIDRGPYTPGKGAGPNWQAESVKDMGDSPYYLSPYEPAPVGSAIPYRHAVETRNRLIEQLMSGFQPSANLPYSQSPYQGGARSLADAFQGMSARQGQTPGAFQGPQLSQQQGPAMMQTQLMSLLAQQEPSRIANLMQLLQGSYASDISAASQYQQLQNAAKQQKLQQRSALGDIFGGIPIVGPIVGGLARRG